MTARTLRVSHYTFACLRYREDASRGSPYVCESEFHAALRLASRESRERAIGLQFRHSIWPHRRWLFHRHLLHEDHGAVAYRRHDRQFLFLGLWVLLPFVFDLRALPRHSPHQFLSLGRDAPTHPSGKHS